MWPNPQETADLVTFTEEILNGNLTFCVVSEYRQSSKLIVIYIIIIVATMEFSSNGRNRVVEVGSTNRTA